MSSPELQALAAARARLGLVAFLVGLAALAWWSTIRAMAGMGASQRGSASTAAHKNRAQANGCLSVSNSDEYQKALRIRPAVWPSPFVPRHHKAI